MYVHLIKYYQFPKAYNFDWVDCNNTLCMSINEFSRACIYFCALVFGSALKAAAAKFISLARGL